jgi:hypothetical protein
MRLPVLLLAVGLSACSTWRPVAPAGIGSPGAADRPDKVRLTLSDETEVVLHRPFVVGDSVVGFAGGGRAAYALVDLRRADTREPDDVRTAALVLGPVAVGFVVVTVREVAEFAGAFGRVLLFW